MLCPPPGASWDSGRTASPGTGSIVGRIGLQGRRGTVGANGARRFAYRVSLWVVCLPQYLQNFLYSTRPVCFFLFFVVE